MPRPTRPRTTPRASIQPLVAATDTFWVVVVPDDMDADHLESLENDDFVDLVWGPMDLARFGSICLGSLPNQLKTEKYNFFSTDHTKEQLVDWLLQRLAAQA